MAKMDRMQRWNRNFLTRKGEKPEQLDDNLTRLEQRIENIKQVCQAVGKKLLACLQLHGVDLEKRPKKLPDSVLSRQLQESSAIFEDNDAFRKTLLLCSRVEEKLATHKINYENEIEGHVLQPLQQLIEKDIPAIVKTRKLVLKQAQEVETLKSRLSAGSRQSMLPQETARKFAQAQEDVEDAANKLELYKDQLATEMYNFYAREANINKIFITLIESQLSYHSQASEALKSILPEMNSVAEECVQQPVFGVALEDHLKHTKQPIATVLKECVTALLSEGVQLEGLFRVAGGTTKLKKLRAAFDAGMVDIEEYMLDPHCVASVLKLYLRELPEPMMTFELYNDWTEAAQCSGEQRLHAIASTLRKMKKPHFDNLKFLIKFLAKVVEYSDVNKMTASNLAIVIGPNLLWSPAVGDGANILTSGVQSAVAESLITNSELFFGSDPEFEMASSDAAHTIAASSRDANGSSSSIAKQMTRKADSNDSLSSSNSLGADGVTSATTASSISSSDVTMTTRNMESDVSSLVPPKRTGKKTHAPLPPSNESAASSTTANVAGVRTIIPSTENIETGETNRMKSTTTSDHNTEPSDNQTLLHASRANFTTVPPPKTNVEVKPVATTEKIEVRQQATLLANVENNSDEDKNVVGPNAKKSNQFAAHQALVSNVLMSGGRKTLLTRPNTTYMEQAKFELMKTAEGQNEGETSTKSEAEEKGQDSHSKEMTGRDAKTRSTETCTSDTPADVKSVGQEKEGKDTVFHPHNDDEQLKKKPERPVKPVRPTPAEVEPGGNAAPKSESGSKTATEEHGNAVRKEEHAAVSSQHHPAQEADTDVGALPKSSAKGTSQEAPGHQQGSGPGMRPPKPPPPATAGSRLPSTSIDENTYL